VLGTACIELGCACIDLRCDRHGLYRPGVYVTRLVSIWGVLGHGLHRPGVCLARLV